MTYLITGGAGFIGSNLVDYLISNGDKVVCIDNFNDFYDPIIKEKNIINVIANPNYKLYRGDIRNTKFVKDVFDNNDIDFVIHLAAMAGVRSSILNPLLYQDVNCYGSNVILEEAKNHNVKNIIMASSSSVYGNCKEVPFKEDMIVDYAISPYAATKKSNEVMAHVYHDLYNMNIIMLRFFTVYGPRQRPDLAISKFTNMILNGDEITMYGDGSTYRDYTYVMDIVSGIIKACDYVKNNKNVYEIINIGSNNPICLKDMIDLISNELGVEYKVKNMPMQQGDVLRTYADISKARYLLGYEPNINFQEGIKKFIKWYKSTNI